MKGQAISGLGKRPSNNPKGIMGHPSRPNIVKNKVNAGGFGRDSFAIHNCGKKERIKGR